MFDAFDWATAANSSDELLTRLRVVDSDQARATLAIIEGADIRSLDRDLAKKVRAALRGALARIYQSNADERTWAMDVVGRIHPPGWRD